MNKKLFPAIAFGLLGALLAVGAVSACSSSAAEAPDKSRYDVQVEELLAKMTLDEKIGQLQQRTAASVFH